MRFSSKQVKGKGRGRLLGFPTINLEIPNDLSLKEGIYATLVWVNGKKYKGALHFGPIPTFNETKKSLEIFLIDAEPNFRINSGETMTVEIKDYLRKIKTFESEVELVQQITNDVSKINSLFSVNS